MDKKSTNRRKLNILIVGCGGLGTELIKILAAEKMHSLTLVDHDTVDLTNLNRQFFFCDKDIGLFKATVIANKIKCMAYCDLIQNIDSFQFYKKFHYVFSCLDNDEGRSYLNQRCYLTSTKLIDGGSAGWLGQAFSTQSECFDCLPKKVQKVHPICTVRQRPENFEQCLAWAQMVFESKDMKSIEAELLEHQIPAVKPKRNNFLNFLMTSVFDMDESTSCESMYDANLLVSENTLENTLENTIENNLNNEGEHKKLKTITEMIEEQTIDSVKENSSNSILAQANEIRKFLDSLGEPVQNGTEGLNDLENLQNQKKGFIKEFTNNNENQSNVLNLPRDDLVSTTEVEFDEKIEEPSEEIHLNQITNEKLFDFQNDPVDFNRTKDPNVFIYSLALLRAKRFELKPLDFLKATSFINKTIPSICSTNSIVASLMVLSACNDRNFYLQGEISPVNPRAPNPECLTCGLPNYICRFAIKSYFEEFVAAWPGVTEIMTEDEVIRENFHVPMRTIHKKFCIVVRNGMKHRVYFEKKQFRKGQVIDMIRVR